MVKNPPAMQETWVRSLGWEDPLRRKREPTPVPRTEEHGSRSQRAGHNLVTKQQHHYFQYSLKILILHMKK